MRRSLLFAASLLCLQGCLFFADEIEPTRTSSSGIDSPAKLFASLQDAYETRSIAQFEKLLAPDYEFQADISSLSNPSENTWGKDVELERHSRMFRAIQNVSCRVQWDGLSPRPEDASRETTWTVWNLEMNMEFEGMSWEIRGMADFRLRAVPQEDGSNLYQIVKWTDRP